MLRIRREGQDVIAEADSFVLALRKEDGWFRQYIHGRREPKTFLRSEIAGSAVKTQVVPVFSEVAVVEEPKCLRFSLKGTRNAHSFSATITLHENENYIRVDIQDRPIERVEIEAITSTYRLWAKDPDFVFAPYIRPFDDNVIGQWGLKSPIIAYHKGDTLILLVADTNNLNEVKPPLPAYLDFDAELEAPRIGYGLTTHKPSGYFYFRHDAGDTISTQAPLRYSYYLVINTDVPVDESAGIAARFLWKHLGEPYLRTALPQVAPLESYARKGMAYAVNTLWDEFDYNGKRCGGIRSGLRYPNDIWFQNQHNALDSALALHYWGSLWKDEELIRKASCVKNLILSSPSERGLFSTVFTANIRFGVRRPQWHTSKHWMSRDIVGEFGSVSTRSLSNEIDWERVHHTVSLSTTATAMLDWYETAEADGELVKRCQAYADHLLGVQEQSGVIPSWIYRDTFEIEAILKENVDAACSGLFLAQLYRVTRDRRYLDAAIRVAEFILKRIRPEQHWQDYETTFDSLAKPINFYDYHTEQYAQTWGGIYWSSELCRILFEMTGKSSWLHAGSGIADYLTLFQAVWSPHFLSMNCFGGFAVGNCHPAWNNAGQQIIGRMLLKYYTITHDSHHLTRGLSAIRSSLPLMFRPENERVARHFSDGPEGWCVENYGHRGQDKAAISSSYDWGLGNLLPSLAILKKEYGTLLVDLNRGNAFGVDGVVIRSCQIEGGRVEIELDDQVGEGRQITATILADSETQVELFINGGRLGGGVVTGGRMQITG